MPCNTQSLGALESWGQCASNVFFWMKDAWRVSVSMWSSMKNHQWSQEFVDTLIVDSNQWPVSWPAGWGFSGVGGWGCIDLLRRLWGEASNIDIRMRISVSHEIIWNHGAVNKCTMSLISLLVKPLQVPRGEWQHGWTETCCCGQQQLPSGPCAPGHGRGLRQGELRQLDVQDKLWTSSSRSFEEVLK